MHQEPTDTEFAYALELLPPGGWGFRRWRFELWHGARLIAAGWRLSREHAERALRTAASRAGHAMLGVHPLNPDRTSASGAFLTGATVRVDCGALTCVLVPRAETAAIQARGAAA
ncbi:hypothetical protein [Conexibacter sp. SYSU D00693]|uniref:hypothetical protein n=1 Tax=Conexibacter sp. SYSU D00693 TaxID=2812560 RepID=UPI00196B2DAC|nr:hypothetical protein [Conexibacter sp. SYSU D00693]